MQNVITIKQAKQITGGRTPLVPIQYEQAVKALQECVDLDDAKVWNDRADALAAWAKIYRDDDAGRKAKILKLHAFRRMGELAQLLRPKCVGSAIGGNRGSAPGPLSALVDHGFTRKQALSARSLAVMPLDKFNALAEKPRIPSPLTLQGRRRDERTAAFTHAMSTLVCICKKYPPSSIAQALAESPRKEAVVDTFRSHAVAIIEWLDELERRLPKYSGKG